MYKRFWKARLESKWNTTFRFVLEETDRTSEDRLRDKHRSSLRRLNFIPGPGFVRENPEDQANLVDLSRSFLS